MKNTVVKLSLLLFLICCQTACQKEFSELLNETEVRIVNDNREHSKATEVQRIIDSYVARGLPGISIVIDIPNEGILRSAAGYSKIEDQTPMEIHHVFNSGSVAKTYHVTAALMMMEEGILDIDKTIDTYLPDWVCDDLPNGRSATVKQLMNHSSGIPDFIENIDHVLDYFHDLQRDFTQEEYLNYICGTKAYFEPGADHWYSNTNTVLLALIMDEISGNHADVITQKIINRLGLKQTFYKNELDYPVPAGAVNTYYDTKGNGEIINSTEIQRNFDRVSIGHDGMLASANDFHLFLKALFENKLVSRPTLETMVKFGLGLDIELVRGDNSAKIGHDGASFGAANQVYFYNEISAIMVVCSNFGDFFNGPLSDLYREMVVELEAVLFAE